MRYKQISLAKCAATRKWDKLAGLTAAKKINSINNVRRSIQSKIILWVYRKRKVYNDIRTYSFSTFEIKWIRMRWCWNNKNINFKFIKLWNLEDDDPISYRNDQKHHARRVCSFARTSARARLRPYSDLHLSTLFN